MDHRCGFGVGDVIGDYSGDDGGVDGGVSDGRRGCRGVAHARRFRRV